MPLQELSQTFPLRGHQVLERHLQEFRRENPGESGANVQVRHTFRNEETQLEPGSAWRALSGPPWGMYTRQVLRSHATAGPGPMPIKLPSAKLRITLGARGLIPPYGKARW